jgi:hypothetical protein
MRDANGPLGASVRIDGAESFSWNLKRLRAAQAEPSRPDIGPDLLPANPEAGALISGEPCSDVALTRTTFQPGS